MIARIIACQNLAKIYNLELPVLFTFANSPPPGMVWPRNGLMKKHYSATMGLIMGTEQ
jgi:hypothetical protein